MNKCEIGLKSQCHLLHEKMRVLKGVEEEDHKYESRFMCVSLAC